MDTNQFGATYNWPESNVINVNLQNQQWQQKLGFHMLPDEAYLLPTVFLRVFIMGLPMHTTSKLAGGGM